MQKIKQRTLFDASVEFREITAPNAGTSLVSGKPVTPATNVTAGTQKERMVRHVQLTLSALSVAVLEANDYGSAKICDLPDTNLLLMAVETDLVLTKGGTTNGLVAGTALDVAIGTAAASNATLSSTMVNVVEKKDIDTSALAVDFNAHSNDNASSVMPLPIADGATALYLNVAAAITADDALTASGTIDLYYLDVGNVTS